MIKAVSRIVVGLFLVAASALPCLAVTQPSTPAESPDAAARRILQHNDYAFCQKPTVHALDIDPAWCEIAEKATYCPAIVQHCLVHSGPQQPGARDLATSASSTQDGAPTKAQPKQRLHEQHAFTSPELSESWRVPDWLAVLHQLAVGLAIGAVLALLVWLWRQRSAPGPSVPPKTAPEPQAKTQAVVIAGEEQRDPQVLLALAQQALAEDPARAYALLYAAALRHLELQGLLRRQASTSNREYLRRIAGKTPLHPLLQQLVRDIERQRFGGATADRSRWAQLQQAIAPLLTVLLVTLMGCAMPGDADLEGRAAVWDLLRSQGLDVHGLSWSLADLDRKSPVVVVDTAQIPLEPSLTTALDTSVRRGARLLLLIDGNQDLGAWLPVAVTATEARGPVRIADNYLPTFDLLAPQPWVPDHQGLRDAALPGDGPSDPEWLQYLHDQGYCWTEAQSCGDEAWTGDDSEEDAATAEPCESSADATEDADVADAASFTAKQAQPAETNTLTTAELPEAPTMDHGQAVFFRGDIAIARHWQLGQGEVVVLAEPRLLSNAALAIPGTAPLVMGLLGVLLRGDSEVALAQVGLVAPPDSPVDSMGRSGLLPLLVHAMLAVGVWLLSRGMALGRLRDNDQRTRRVFAEHVQALGQHLRRKRASRLAASQYASWALERLWLRDLRPGQPRHWPTLAAAVAQRCGRPLAQVAALLEKAETIRQTPDNPSFPQQDLALIEALESLLEEAQPSAPSTPAVQR